MSECREGKDSHCGREIAGPASSLVPSPVFPSFHPSRRERIIIATSHRFERRLLSLCLPRRKNSQARLEHVRVTLGSYEERGPVSGIINASRYFRARHMTILTR